MLLNSFIVSLVKNWPLVGRNVDYGKKGSFLKSWINFSWNDSLYVLTCVFDLEIEIWVWFAKTNQVVAKDDPYMPKMNQNRFEFYLKWYCTCSSCFMLCWHKSPKRGRLKGKCALGAISKYFGDWVPTQVLKCEFMLMDEQSANQE